MNNYKIDDKIFARAFQEICEYFNSPTERKKQIDIKSAMHTLRDFYKQSERKKRVE